MAAARLNAADIVARLLDALTPKGVVADAGEMAPYLQDWRGRATGSAIAVALPSTTQETAAVMHIAHETGTPVFPQGGNTGLCMGAVPDPASQGIVLALRRLDRIRSADPESAAIIVEAGVPLARVHEEAVKLGRTFPLHLGSEGSAQIGGLISTNAGGTGAVRYGTMRDLVLGLEVVLADGQVLDGLSVLRKDNTGYDLKHLFIGAEGTLGIVTAAALKLYPALHARADAWVQVATPAQAVELLQRTQARFDTGVQAFELLSGSQVEAVLEHVPGRRCPFAEVPEWNVLIELGAADGSMDLKGSLEELLAKAHEDGIVADAAVAQNLREADAFWTLRHSVSEANKKAGHGVTLDISVPLSQAATFIERADALRADRYAEAQAFVVAHLGDGNVHYIPMFDHETWHALDDPDGYSDEVLRGFHDVALACGGSFSAEHGIGRKLTGELQRLTDPKEMELFRALKRLFDPTSILNPGAVIGE